MIERILGAALTVAILAALVVIWRGCRDNRPLVDKLDPPKVASGETVTIDAGAEPTERDTAAVSGSGGTPPEYRIVYRDRWRELPAPECADGSTPEADTTQIRVVYVPAETRPLAELPGRPVQVTNSRVTFTYREAEGETPGRTVQEVFSVPEATWGAGLSLASLVPLDTTWRGLDLDRAMVGVVARARYRRVSASGAVWATVTGEIRPTVGLSVRLWDW